MKKKSASIYFIGSLLAGISVLSSCNRISTEGMISVPMGGNAYITGGERGAVIDKNGLTRWSDEQAVVSAWFKTSQAGKLDVALRAKSEASANLKMTVADETFDVKIPAGDWAVIPVGSVTLPESGYIRVDLQVEKKGGETFAEISDLMIGGEAASDSLNYVPDDFEFYWARRGPSVHIGYQQPQEEVEYFYNELTVPEGNDVIGSYFMANGFGEGYFGIQVNSESERRVLFSVWSPFDTQDPDKIPEDQKIKMLRRGEDVHIGEFGNEGSGGQSYLVYPWKAGNTYKFLTQVRPDGKGNTVYTSYFFATDENRWRLIASFLRPKTDTWYRGAHSFLENFIPTQGYITRQVEFGNQWVLTREGVWKELTEATFTYDNTAAAQVRVDYAGGTTESGRFFLKNCGFFNENTPYRSKFSRPAKGEQPQIDLKALETIEKKK